MPKTGFDTWMVRVDRAVAYATCGMSVHDLADAPFSDWWEDGITPTQAARMILAEEGF
jgi:hypothetical protein